MTAAPESSEPLARRARPRRRLGLLLGAVALVAVLIAGMWAVAVAFESPAQREAAATPPTPGPVLATVTKGDLARTVRSRAAIVRAHRQQVRLTAPDSTAVVTASSRAAGAELVEGSVILELNGRPRFATRGAFPYYRDLVPGSTGPDVRQLQEALGVPADGAFGPRTVAAVRAMYRSAGFDAPSKASAQEPAEDPSGTTAEPSRAAEPAPSTESAPPTESAPHTAPAPATVVVPAAELIALKQLPASIVSVPAVGELDPDDLLEVESGDLVVRSTLPGTVASELSDTVPVTISAGGTRIPGRIAARVAGGDRDAGPRTGARGDAEGAGSDTLQPDQESQIDVVAADGSALDPGWRGSAVTVIIVVAVAAEDSLLVPSVAVVSGRGGSATVRKQNADNTFSSVRVDEQATMDGRSAVTPVEPRELVPGDRVRVG